MELDNWKGISVEQKVTMEGYSCWVERMEQSQWTGNRTVEVAQHETENEKCLRDLWDSSTIWNICDHQCPKRKERSEAKGTLEEIIAENVQGLWKANLQLREAKLTSNRINPKKSMLKHIIVKSLKTKNRKSWNWLKMNSRYLQGTSIWMTIYFYLKP